VTAMSEPLRVLTVRQPWAWAIIHGQKDVENRVRNIAGSYRGPVAIHAALTGANFDWRHPDLWPFDKRHITGHIIGVVDLWNVHHASDCLTDAEILPGTFVAEGPCSPWAEEDNVYHIMLRNPQVLTTPVPYRGALGLRRMAPHFEALVWEQVRDE